MTIIDDAIQAYKEEQSIEQSKQLMVACVLRDRAMDAWTTMTGREANVVNFTPEEVRIEQDDIVFVFRLHPNDYSKHYWVIEFYRGYHVSGLHGGSPVDTLAEIGKQIAAIQDYLGILDLNLDGDKDHRAYKSKPGDIPIVRFDSTGETNDSTLQNTQI
jgi:hypothetical protein